MPRSDRRRNPRTSRRTAWLLIAIALPLMVAGIAVPNGLLIAAGLILAGLIGISDHR
ncbi:hypothetical protein [Actinophytocola sp.]|uniref:hypothetical protein n=1 Tax=Actinophytocola sp. TaxID=1872138 RepID=UPI003D6B207D